MEAINADSKIHYKILQESDYEISKKNLGKKLFGSISKEDMLESFQIKEPKAVLTNEKLKKYKGLYRHRYYTNKTVDNNTRVLIIGDSYFHEFIVDDLAESFHEVILIWVGYVANIKKIIRAFPADIVIIESAERSPKFKRIIEAGKEILNSRKRRKR